MSSAKRLQRLRLEVSSSANDYLRAKGDVPGRSLAAIPKTFQKVDLMPADLTGFFQT
jgi:hypothetical protein